MNTTFCIWDLSILRFQVLHRSAEQSHTEGQLFDQLGFLLAHSSMVRIWRKWKSRFKPWQNIETFVESLDVLEKIDRQNNLIPATSKSIWNMCIWKVTQVILESADFILEELSKWITIQLHHARFQKQSKISKSSLQIHSLSA